MASKITAFRYPGISPFEGKLKDRFFGRDHDIERLRTLIEVEKQVLLYAKSGVGKSSLLAAGVLPQLDPKAFLPISVRFFAYMGKESLSPYQSLHYALQHQAPSAGLERLPLLETLAAQEKEERLWTLAKRLQVGENPPTLLLVFDQFEELFTYPEAQVRQFKHALYELLYSKLPDTWLDLLGNLSDEQPELLGNAALAQLQKPMRIKPLFAIRTDRLALVNALTDKFPDLHEFYYELRPLTREDARAAIENPAKLQKDSLEKNRPESADFSFTDEATTKILDFLGTNAAGEAVPIESSQLQIICQEIEKTQVIGQQKTKIEAQDVPDFKRVFKDFYQKALRDLPEAQQATARRLAEDKLIINGQRISLDEKVCLSSFEGDGTLAPLTQDTLNHLVDARLLRRVKNSLGGDSYELSHDTLVAPIQALAQARKQEEAEAQHQEELRQAREKAEAEKRERERTRKNLRLTQGLLAVAVLAVVAALYFGWEAQKQQEIAIAQKERAEVKTKEAEKEKKKAEKALIQALKADHGRLKAEQANYDNRAKTLDNIGEPGSAEEVRQKAQGIKAKIDSLAAKIEDMQRE